MAKQKRPSFLMALAWMLLGVLIIIAGALGVNVSDLYGQMKYAQSLTPTPLPAYGNVMQVTIDPNAPTPQPVLRVGSQGSEVWQLQERLSQLGYYHGAIDGQYGEGTQAAVRLFQEQHGLGADGLYGQQTREMLYSAEAHYVIVYTATPAPTATPKPTPTLEPKEAGGFGSCHDFLDVAHQNGGQEITGQQTGSGFQNAGIGALGEDDLAGMCSQLVNQKFKHVSFLRFSRDLYDCFRFL